MLSLLNDLGVKVRLNIWTDSSASKGICSRQGLGKVRHLDTQDLWVQQRIRNGDFALYKIKGDDNPGDLFTKAGLSHARIRCLLAILGCHYREGRAESAPKLRPNHDKPKQLGLQGQRWSDLAEEDGHGEECTEKELENFIQTRQLPHWNRDAYTPEMATPEHSEVAECKDPMMVEGEALARAGKGRAPLPWQSSSSFPTSRT